MFILRKKRDNTQYVTFSLLWVPITFKQNDVLRSIVLEQFYFVKKFYVRKMTDNFL